MIGEEIVQQPPLPVFFFTPGPVRRVPKLGKEFTICSCLERFGTAKRRGTRRLDARAQRQDYDSLPYNKGGPGGQAATFLDTENGRRDPPKPGPSVPKELDHFD